MIETMHLKFGRSPNSPGEITQLTPITIFVGPNNSGKSRILTEISDFCNAGRCGQNAVLLNDLSFKSLGEECFDDLVKKITLPPNPKKAAPKEHVYIGKQGRSNLISFQDIDNIRKRQKDNISGFCHYILCHFSLILNGINRLTLVNQQKAGDLQGPPENTLQELFRDDTKRHEVRRILFDAFGSYFVIDPTNLGHLRARFSDTEPSSDSVERGLTNDSVQFHRKALPTETLSDGMKAFTGIITELIAGDPQVVLIDEPEAFLHPPLAFKLGKELSLIANKTSKSVFVSTHSSHFVMGCVQAGVPINIIRLTYNGGVATARVLPSDNLVALMQHPLLRSTGLLNGLFYGSVVVTESDTDRVFYQEINERLLQNNPTSGIPNCLFINAQNKQTIPILVEPLRKLGIPAAGIVDIDALKEGGQVWSKLLRAAGFPDISIHSLATHRAAICKLMEDIKKSTNKDMKRDGGIEILTDSERQSASDLLKQLAEYGIFVVAKGELESWLKPLNVPGHGPEWLIEIFQKMGHDPSQATYLRPSSDDVWEFISTVGRWCLAFDRKGIPS